MTLVPSLVGSGGTGDGGAIQHPDAQLLSSTLEFQEALAAISMSEFGFPAALKLLIQTFQTPWRGLQCGVQPAHRGSGLHVRCCSAFFCRPQSLGSLLNWGGLKTPRSFHEMDFAACLQAAQNPKGIAEHTSDKIASGGRE